MDLGPPHQTGNDLNPEDAMRERLLEAAESLYAAKGPDALTSRAIAQVAETTTEPIYTLFGDHSALAEAMYTRAIDELNAILDNTDVFAPSDVSARNDVWFAVAYQYRAYCKVFPGRFRLIRTGGAEVGVPGAAALQDKLVTRLVEISLTDDNPDPELLEARLRTSASCIHGFIQAELDGFVPHEVADQMYDELLTRFSAAFDQLTTV